MSNILTIDEFNRVKNIPMVFIMGKERSGTTLLQTLLDANPNIVGPPESEFVILLYPRFGKIKNWKEKDILDFINELYKEPWITKIWRIDRDMLTATLLAIKEKADYASICKVIYYCMRNNKEGILWFSDKNPMYVLFVTALLKIFPEASFIHLVRDPRDNVYSHLKSFGAKNAGFVAQKWMAYNDILLKAAKIVPGKFHTLLYERMVEDPETTMKELCKFLNVPFDERMIHNAFPESLEAFKNQKLLLERVQEIHSNLLKPINTSNIGKWKTGMNAEDLTLVEKITATFSKRNFNYAIELPGASLGTNLKIFKAKVVYSCWQFFTRIKYKSYWFNTLYTRVNLYFGRETRVFGKVLRDK